jgi:hypothetical protein
MKIKCLVFAIALCAGLNVYAQQRSVFRPGYVRLGLTRLGDELNYRLSPKENIFDGRYGTSTGYVFEFGHIFYFNKRASKNPVNLGLDWTILSFTYNKMDKWNDYARAAAAPNAFIEGEQIAGAASSKLGPNLSINLGEKVVLDLRFQVAPTLRYFDFTYTEDPFTNTNTGRYFSFENSEQLKVDRNFDPQSLKNRLAFGLNYGYGVTLRRAGLGLSLDYTTGEVNSNYEAYDELTGGTFGKEKIKANSIQLKLSLTL